MPMGIRAANGVRCGVALAFTLLLTLAAPLSVSAAILDTDLVGGAAVGQHDALRSQAPDLYVPAGQLTTIDGRELWARSPVEHRAMASTTKIMTAIVVLERAKVDPALMDDMVQVGTLHLAPDESTMGLRRGETVTVRQLLEGLLIASGNDAATTLALHVGGTVPAFVKMMNAEAVRLDLKDTHYTNPVGLDEAGHYTSAADLTSLARFAMRNPEFRRIVGTVKLKVTTQQYIHDLVNHNLLLTNMAGAEGIKTGSTTQAGYCLVGAAKRGDIELVGTILDAANDAGRVGQAKRLLEWGFKHYRSVQAAAVGERTGNVLVTDYVERTVPTMTGTAAKVAWFDVAGPVKRSIALAKGVQAPVVKGQRLGTMTISQGDQMLAQVPLVAAVDVPAPTFFQRIGITFSRLWRAVFGG